MFSCEFCEIFKNNFFTEHLWTSAFEIRNVECGILAIKKTSVKTLQIGLYSVFLNLPIKHVQEKKKEKKFDCKRKFFYLNFSSIATLKNKDMIFYVNFVSWAYILFWLTACIFDFFYLRIPTTIMNCKSETLGKLSKHQTPWWKRCAG